MKHAQIFPRAANSVTLGIFVFIVLCGGAAAVVLGLVARSPFYTRVDMVVAQPVPFSHQHHVGGLGIDCRYCHTTAETAPFAGVPPTETCMTCHSQVWKDAPVLQPVRDSFRDNQPIRWNRVHDLPGFVYFDHSVHVNRGVACRECHGDVDRMPLIRKKETLFMQWCLDCHRHPDTRIGAPAQVFNPRPPASKEVQSWLEMQSAPPGESNAMPRIQTITDCTACHR